MTRAWVPVFSDQVVDEDGRLVEPEKFKSDISDLRPHPADNWGYRIVTREPGQPVPAKSRQKAKSKQSAAEKHDRTIKPGQPQIDRGAASLVKFPAGDQSRPPSMIDEKTHPYCMLLGDTGFMLREYDYLFDQKIKKRKSKKKNAEGVFIVVPAHTILKSDPRKTKAKGAENIFRRMTVDVSPSLARAVQLMIEAGMVVEARKILDQLLPEMALELERIFPDAKVACCGWHVLSGQLHADFWVHCTKLEEHNLGEKQTPTLCRIWDPGGLAHQGPGPGICAWDRHMSALGDEMDDLAPGTCREVREALKYHEARAVERGRPDVANRDIAIHRKFDEMVEKVLPAVFVEDGKEAYRSHLRTVYADGDPKVLTLTADPERVERYIAKITRNLKLARNMSKDAKKALLAVEVERESLAKQSEDIRVRNEVLVSLKETVSAREAGLPALEKTAEISGIKTAFRVVFPEQEPKGESADSIGAEIKAGIQTINDDAVAARDAAGVDGLKAAFKVIFPDRDIIGDTQESIGAEIITGIKAANDDAVAARNDAVVARAAAKTYLSDISDPIPVAEVAANLRFVSEEGAADGGLTREVKKEGQANIWQRIVLKGQKFVFSIVGSDKLPVEGAGAFQLIRATNPNETLERVLLKLSEWFPKKKHAIMAELISHHGSALLKEMVRREPDDIPPPPGNP